MLAAIEPGACERRARARRSACSPSHCGTGASATLILARDRIGEKPLYYGRQTERAVLFGSELKALRAAPAVRRRASIASALALYLRYSYIPAPYSIYRGIAKLRPGSILTLREARRRAGDRANTGRRAAVAEAGGGRSASRLRPRSATDELEALLTRAVGQQMIADVPLGAFLSGGIDSSTVVALMQTAVARPVKTFTIGFHEERSTTRPTHAKAVARHLGTDHTELYVTPEEALAVDPAAAGDLRRAVRRLVADPDLSRVGAGAAARDGRRCRATAATSCSAATTATSWRGGSWRRLRAIPAAVARRRPRRALRALPPALWNAVARAAALPESRACRDARRQDRTSCAAALRRRLGDGALRRIRSQWTRARRARARRRRAADRG